MPTVGELFRVLLWPLVVSGLIAAVGRWRMWAWAMPLALGVGFMTGVAALIGQPAYFGRPALPPADGTDWLFWLAIPLTVVGILDATRGGKWGWLMGLVAAGVAYVILRPLPTTAYPHAQAFVLVLGLGVAAAAAALAARITRPSIGSWAVGIALAITLGAAGVVVMSSGLRVVGLYGLAAAAATGPAAVLMPRKGRGVTVVAMGLLAGLLTGGRFYPDPGVTMTSVFVLAAAPLLLIPAVFVPSKLLVVRAIVGVTLVAVAVAAVAVPTAVAAKKAAEEDPNAAYGY